MINVFYRESERLYANHNDLSDVTKDLFYKKNEFRLKIKKIFSCKTWSMTIFPDSHFKI
jgi:hypothetical protein